MKQLDSLARHLITKQSHYKTIFTLLILFATTCKLHASFVDSSSLKPSIVLILPQSFKVPTSPVQQDSGEDQPKFEQYVAVINNVHNERDDKLIREQFKKLSLQVRDANSPITGQLFYEHVFDYFPPQPSKQHLLIPINLDQVSPTHETLAPTSARSYVAALTGSEIGIISRPQHLIVSIRPHQLESGFGSESIEFVSSVPVPVESVPSSDGRRSFGIVQTDKPVYKPEDKVRIRSLVINENLRPIIRDELRLQVKNPHKVIVEEIRFPNNETQQHSSDPMYLDYVFEFPPEPMLGTWTVHLLHSDPIANDTTSFEVKEYILPTYEIEFESPKYILPNTQIISGFIIAKYHHGKPVQGKAQFKFGYKESASARPKFIARSSIKSVDPTTGRVDFKINSEKFKETEWFPSISGSRLFIEATVTETATGHREVSQDASCVFISTPYKISFEDSIEDFKLGLSQQLTVQVLEMQTNRPAPVGARLTAQYMDQNGTFLDVPSQIANNQTADFRQVLDTEAATDESGYATFNVGPIREGISSIQVTVKWTNTTRPKTEQQSMYNDLAVGHHILVKHESRNGWISFMNKSITHLNIGDIFISDLLIRDAVVIPQKVFYIIIARGQIIALESLNSDGLVKFTITESMMPSIRVVLFALTHDSIGLLSDSLRINVAQDLSCGLTIRYKSNEANTGPSFRPNDKGKLAIQARQGDLVSIIGVDSAVYTMNNRSRLDSSKIIQRIKRLDTGCGFGGGKNNLDVFRNAGLMLFRDVHDSNPDEPHLGSACLTVQNQLKHIDDIQLGYSRPMFMSLAKMSRPRLLELGGRAQSPRHSRTKRETDVESILNKYKDFLDRSCCHLGTLEDIPQRRNCSVRSRIVEKYMRQSEYKSCAKIYFDCCRAVFGDYLLLGSLVTSRASVEPILETKILPSYYAPQFGEAVVLSNVGHLDRIEVETLTRKDFRETWLFELVNVNQPNGMATIDTQLPHSITSWSVSAMALNRYQPMCIMSQPLRISTFQEIFLHVSMPYKVIQGEQIDLVATIFNYSPNGQEVLVYMYGVEDVCSEAEPGERSDRKRLRLDKQSSQSVIFPMIPLKIGKFPIKILAITPSSSSSDIVERDLNVVARGKSVTDETTFSLDPLNQQRRSKRAIQTGNLVDEIDSTKGLQHSKVRLTPMRDSEYIVPNTQECIVSAIGDRMGQSVQTTMIDVENLIRLPHGCGEQVMIYLGPTLYTTRYLSSINKLTGDLRWRAIRYIQSGYKRILNYRKETGAFSAFARRDASIWLTAFISKMLCQTERTPFVAEEIHIDKTVVNTALRWLINMQNEETGTWVEINPVYHREMLGGVLKENALTAFVTLALNECAHHSPDMTEEIELGDSRRDHFGHVQTNGVDKLKVATQLAERALMLDRYKAVKERNPYVMALTAYALSSTRPNDAASILGDLLVIADRSQSRNQLFWRGDYPIETASYALQALIELAPVISMSSVQQKTPSTGNPRSAWLPGADALAIANWLASRRSYTGAFESTQDTVVALEALSKFAQLQSTPNGQSLVPHTSTSSPSLTCNVTLSNRTRRSIEFDKDNSQILQTFKIDSFEIDSVSGEMIDVLTSGNGLGTMSVKLKYNVFQEEDELCRFNIDSSIDEWQPKINLHHGTSSDLSPNSAEPREPIKVVVDQADEDLEDEYFKTFDKSMLSELNLVNLNQQVYKEPKSQSNPEKVFTSKPILRTRRLASHMIDLSSKESSSTQDSWASKIISSLKASLPSWLSPKRNSHQQSTTTASPTPTDLSTIPTALLVSDVPTKKTNTSRRSTQSSTIPLVVLPGTIPADAKLNPLGRQIELGTHNETHSLNNGDIQQYVEQPSHRLVLLLRVCVHHLSTRRDSEMAVIEVGIISGFKPNEADLKEIVDDPGTPAMKYELSTDKSLVIIYMHYIPYSGPYCIQFRLVRDSLVYNLQSGYIRVYEYYSPAHSCSNFYTPTRVTDLMDTKCDSSGQVCKCATKSLCPATNKLLNLGEVYSVNATSARNQLMELICSNRFDLVSLVRLKNVRQLEAGKMFKISVKVKSDLKGNLTKIINLQHQQRSQQTSSVRKPTFTPIMDMVSESAESYEEDNTSLDHLSLNIDSTCVRNDPFLLHLAHPNQWKQGGELMILFARQDKLEKRFLKTTAKSIAPRPKGTIISGITVGSQENNLLVDAQQLQYSLALQLDKDSILHDLTYQAKSEQRETINNLILWLELRSRREKWTCRSSELSSKL